MNKKLYFCLVFMVLCNIQNQSAAMQVSKLGITGGRTASELSIVLTSYETALQDFLKAHQALNSTKTIEFAGSNVIFSTFCKIISPYVAYVAGYGRIVSQEFARKFPYHADLQTLSDEFFKYDKEVKRIVSFFPKSSQNQAIDYFYEQLTDSVAQVCYQIIKEVSYALSVDSQDLASVYVAYNLAWAIQTKNMKMTGLAPGVNFRDSITKLMVTLYQTAVMKKTHSLDFNAENAVKNKIMIAEIGAYQEILYHIYSNAGQKEQAAKQLLAISASKNKLADTGKYAQAVKHVKKLPSVAQVIAQTGVKAGATTDVQLLQTAATAAFTQAQAAEATGDFAQAMTQYGIMQTNYLKMLNIPSLAANLQSNKTQYFLAKTRWTASSLASTVNVAGSSSWGDLKNVPTSYTIGSYDPQVNLTLLSTTLPASLSTLSLNQVHTHLSDAQKADIIQIFKAYLVSQVLIDQSLNFAECFDDYLLHKKSGLSAINISTIDEAVAQINHYMKKVSPAIISAVDITSATMMTIQLVHMPVPAVTPLYTVGICAGDYFLGAHSLFETGSALISLYGSVYVPGNDTLAAQAMLQNMAYAYCSAAQNILTQAKEMMQEIVKEIDGSGKGTAQVLPKNFMVLYAQIKQAFVQCQSLLVASDTSAQAYFSQAGASDLAQIVQSLYLQTYQTSIAFMKQCLVGDPVSAEYNNILLDINTAYLQWGSELDAASDALQIARINQDIVHLFVVAGQQCLNTPYHDDMFAGFKQVHYDTAAQNFLAAQKQYKSMKNEKMAQAMADKVNDAYFSGCDQNIELYFYVKNHGVSYKSSSTGQMVLVSFEQLCKDYTSFEQVGTLIDSSEIQAYNMVQNLLLTATMMYQYLAGLFQAPSGVAAPAVKAPAAAKSKIITPQQKVLDYLQNQKIIAKTDLAVPLTQAGIKEKILQIAPAAYVYFLPDKPSLGAWLNTLIQVVQNLYMQDYLGATKSETTTQLTTQTKEFFDAVQKEASNMQNPSSAYIG